jgi:hypothetical protein
LENKFIKREMKLPVLSGKKPSVIPRKSYLLDVIKEQAVPFFESSKNKETPNIFLMEG